MRIWSSIATVVLLIGLVAFGCEKKEDQEKGSISYEGSSTIGDNVLDEAVPAFEKKTGHTVSKVGNAGSGKGFKAAMSGEVNIGGLSRGLHDDERDQKPYHRVIGYDALAVFVHASNPVQNLSKDALKGIFTGQITDWSQVGGTPGPISAVTELLEGGRATTEVFRKMGMDGAEFGEVKQVDLPADCVAEVAKNPNAIGYAALAFRVDGVKAISIDDTPPSLENVQSGAYMLSRPLILVSKGTPEGATKDFFEFMLSSEGQGFVAKKFVPISQ